MQRVRTFIYSRCCWLIALYLFSNISSANNIFYTGADLSYVNEMEDCGATYRLNHKPMDPFAIFAAAQANLIRARLWHNAQWTHYSNFDDVKKTIERAKAQHLSVLLDLHYSDSWVDPHKQIIPKAWANLANDTPALGKAVYEYTYSTLEKLAQENLLPDQIQIGNETNIEILQPEGSQIPENDSAPHPIHWERNAFLLNKGLLAVKEFNEKNKTHIKKVLHIAQPENALWWFKEAMAAGVTDFDIIGLSYYPKWSTYKVADVSNVVQQLKNNFHRDVLIVETAYPWTLINFDKANNVLGQDSLLAQYPATPTGQYQYLMDLAHQVILGGGIGVIYWEPAWVSTHCKTLWGTGSHWENAAMFNSGEKNEALQALRFFKDSRVEYQKVNSVKTN